MLITTLITQSALRKQISNGRRNISAALFPESFADNMIFTFAPLLSIPGQPATTLQQWMDSNAVTIPHAQFVKWIFPVERLGFDVIRHIDDKHTAHGCFGVDSRNWAGKHDSCICIVQMRAMCVVVVKPVLQRPCAVHAMNAE
jgi:hypothetical protein